MKIGSIQFDWAPDRLVDAKIVLKWMATYFDSNKEMEKMDKVL